MTDSHHSPLDAFWRSGKVTADSYITNVLDASGPGLEFLLNLDFIHLGADGKSLEMAVHYPFD